MCPVGQKTRESKRQQGGENQEGYIHFICNERQETQYQEVWEAIFHRLFTLGLWIAVCVCTWKRKGNLILCPLSKKLRIGTTRQYGPLTFYFYSNVQPWNTSFLSDLLCLQQKNIGMWVHIQMRHTHTHKQFHPSPFVIKPSSLILGAFWPCNLIPAETFLAFITQAGVSVLFALCERVRSCVSVCKRGVVFPWIQWWALRLLVAVH